MKRERLPPYSRPPCSGGRAPRTAPRSCVFLTPRRPNHFGTEQEDVERQTLSVAENERTAALKKMKNGQNYGLTLLKNRNTANRACYEAQSLFVSLLSLNFCLARSTIFGQPCCEMSSAIHSFQKAILDPNQSREQALAILSRLTQPQEGEQKRQGRLEHCLRDPESENSSGWFMHVPSRFNDALDIRQTERMENGVKKTLWTQWGKFFFQAG